MSTEPDRSADEAQILALEAAYDAAWSRADAAALVASFCEDAVVVNPRGQAAYGKAALEAILAGLLAGPFAGSSHESVVRRVRFVGADVAIVDGEARVEGAGAPITHAFTDVFVRRGGRWLISDVRAYVFMPGDGSGA